MPPAAAGPGAQEARDIFLPRGEGESFALSLLWIPAKAGMTVRSGAGGGRPYHGLRANDMRPQRRVPLREEDDPSTDCGVSA